MAAPFVFTAGAVAVPLPVPPADDEASAALPVDLVAGQIATAVRNNRVTLIFGATGSGKSTRVPVIVRDALAGAVLCTMPRRLAATAAAHRCASSCSPPAEVGGSEVGCHIGAERRCTSSTRLLFATAGVLVELVRGGGEAALDRFKAVIVDEVHERSIENDLALALLRALLRKRPNLRCVLMSATFDAPRYEAYFSDDAFGRAARVAIPDEAPGVRFLTYYRSSVEYLDAVLRLPGFELHAASGELESDAAGAMHLPPALHGLIRDLVLHLHRNVCRSRREVILVFLPTFRAMEHQFELLAAAGRGELSVRALHSAIDMETCAAAIAEVEDPDSEGRRVILATNVAESSVTIPGVTAVIDSCRTLSLNWNPSLGRDVPVVRFISKSQAEQRKGRTGRTCAGTCYRLVRRTKYEMLQTHETAAVRCSSLREPSLVLACSASTAHADPHALLGACLDPPERGVVTSALAYLQKVDAVSLRANGRPQPTLLGRLLVALPLALPAARLAVLGGTRGLARDAAALAAVLDRSPLPILQPFGDSTACAANLQLYRRGARPGDRAAALLANLAAYEFWQRCRRDEARWAALMHLASTPTTRAEAPLPPTDNAAEERWCAAHRLSLTALLQIESTVNQIMDTFHRWRPAFMAEMPTPAWAAGDAAVDHDCSVGALCALSVPQPHELFPVPGLTMRLEGALLSILEPNDEGSDEIDSEAVNGVPSAATPAAAMPTNGAPTCVYFLRPGGCTKPGCRFLHAAQARPPPCRFFGTTAGCSFGSRCAYYHAPAAAAGDVRAAPPTAVSAAELVMPPLPPPDWLPALLLRPSGEPADEVLVLDDDSLSFSEALCARRAGKAVVAACPASRAALSVSASDRASRLEASASVKALYNVDITRLDRSDVAWDFVGVVVCNFPRAPGEDADDAPAHRRLLRALLRSVTAHLLLCSPEARLLLTLRGDQASRWSLDSAARDAFMHCEASWTFDAAAWPGYVPPQGPGGAAATGAAADAVTYCLMIMGRGDREVDAQDLEGCFEEAEAEADADEADEADEAEEASPAKDAGDATRGQLLVEQAHAALQEGAA